jgi:hypothetical protein
MEKAQAFLQGARLWQPHPSWHARPEMQLDTKRGYGCSMTPQSPIMTKA